MKVGVAFPEYDNEKHHLGSKLRLVAPSQELLVLLNVQTWMSRLNDYVHITGIRDVPDTIRGYVFFKRIQTKNNNARLTRREGIGNAQALSNLGERMEEFSNAPYVQIKSQSSGKKYRLKIGCVET